MTHSFERTNIPLNASASLFSISPVIPCLHITYSNIHLYIYMSRMYICAYLTHTYYTCSSIFWKETYAVYKKVVACYAVLPMREFRITVLLIWKSTLGYMQACFYVQETSWQRRWGNMCLKHCLCNIRAAPLSFHWLLSLHFFPWETHRQVLNWDWLGIIVRLPKYCGVI